MDAYDGCRSVAKASPSRDWAADEHSFMMKKYCTLSFSISFLVFSSMIADFSTFGDVRMEEDTWHTHVAHFKNDLHVLHAAFSTKFADLQQFNAFHPEVIAFVCLPDVGSHKNLCCSAKGIFQVLPELEIIERQGVSFLASR